MDYKFLDLESNLQICIIDNIFTDTEYTQIYNELEYINKFQFFVNDSKAAGSAIIKNSYLTKHRYTLALDRYYENNRLSSSFLTYYKKGVDQVIKPNINSISKIWNLLFATDYDSTLLARFTEDGEYDSHIDSAAITQIFYIHNEPKQFTGGDLVFTDYNYTVEYKANRMILFPSFYKHKVTKVKADTELNTIDCRFSYSTFYL